MPGRLDGGPPSLRTPFRVYDRGMSETSDEGRGIEGHRWFAAFYDRLMAATEPRMVRVRQRLVSDVRGDVLEIGAGTGANFPYYPEDAHVVALEPDPHMLERAQRRLDETGKRNIDLRLVRAESLPFPDNSFDTVISTLVLCTVEDLPGALAEIQRVLRPGGELRFLEHVRGNGALGAMQDVIKPVWKWCSAGCNPNRRTEQSLRDAGFDLPDVQHRKFAPWMPAIIGTARVPAPVA